MIIKNCIVKIDVVVIWLEVLQCTMNIKRRWIGLRKGLNASAIRKMEFFCDEDTAKKTSLATTPTFLRFGIIRCWRLVFIVFL